MNRSVRMKVIFTNRKNIFLITTDNNCVYIIINRNLIIILKTQVCLRVFNYEYLITNSN